jgi:hypothetical protein
MSPPMRDSLAGNAMPAVKMFPESLSFDGRPDAQRFKSRGRESPLERKVSVRPEIIPRRTPGECSTIPPVIFTSDQREHLRSELVALAQKDPKLCGAAHTGSAATARLDRWSDIDLALCLKPRASHAQVVAEWTDHLYQRHHAVSHVDVMRGSVLFRVFLLTNTLQVDIAFWPSEGFAAIGPNFKLIFGDSKPPQPAPQADPHFLIGMAWLYALHVRSSLARGRLLQAEYMLSGMRNHVLELTCLRCSTIASQGRGLDDLPASEQKTAVTCIPQSMEPSELKRAFQTTIHTLQREISPIDADLGKRLAGPLNAIAECA